MNLSSDTLDVAPSGCTRRTLIGTAAATALAVAAPVAAGSPARPQTLLEIAGAPMPEIESRRAALVVIDHQQEYVDGGLPLAGMPDAISEIGSLLRWARATDVPVFHVLHNGPAGSALFAPGSRGAQIIAPLAPVAGERVIVKRLPNGFAGTRLHETVANVGRDQLVLCGFATHMCLDATTRAALDLGYQSFVIASATADRDLPNPLGGIVPAAQVKQAALAGLADRFARVLPTASALAGRA